MRAHSAADLVVATMACIGLMPPSTMRSSSSALVPCGPTPVSVPMAILTPFSTAMRKLAWWSATTSLALRSA